MKNTELPPDEVLLQRFQQGDAHAFEQIYKLYVPGLIEFAARRLESLSESEDIIQDLFLDLWSKRGKVLINYSLKAYLFAAVRYKVVDHIRRNINRDYYQTLVRSLNTEADNATFNNILYKDMNGFLELEIEKLPCRMREVFILSRKRHLSISEIASTLKVSDQTVKNQLTTALKRLRPSFDKFMFLLLLLSLLR